MPSRPVLLVFFGLIASGKSFLAGSWAKKHRVPYYNSDRIRKQLAGLVPTERQHAPVGEGIYTPAFSRRTYDALLERAAAGFDDGAGWVVLDGSYQARDERQRVLSRFAAQCRVVFVLCRCPEEVMKERMAQRAADPAAVSDGRWEIYLKQKKKFDPPVELSDEQLLVINTDKPVESLVALLDCELGKKGCSIE